MRVLMARRAHRVTGTPSHGLIEAGIKCLHLAPSREVHSAGNRLRRRSGDTVEAFQRGQQIAISRSGRLAGSPVDGLIKNALLLAEDQSDWSAIIDGEGGALIVFGGLSFCFGNAVAHLAGIFTTEGHFRGLGNRAVIRVVVNHISPRHNLQEIERTNCDQQAADEEEDGAKFHHHDAAS